ncbi:hypothetical protein BKA65DRAFT_515311 [Rhexocercosporidium sp. MPI-PUGE-AT-0058]|nr:hypothetical protein BKA65DRAFT_515311 [Rhexocercosporidium sp. MPI-PUGE-AT-0058]
MSGLRNIRLHLSVSLALLIQVFTPPHHLRTPVHKPSHPIFSSDSIIMRSRLAPHAPTQLTAKTTQPRIRVIFPHGICGLLINLPPCMNARSALATLLFFGLE